jgi:hypothetical protein
VLQGQLRRDLLRPRLQLEEARQVTEDRMPTPLEICLEETALPPDDERYIRCVALPGSAPGLALDRQGAVRWMPDAPADYGLWVSGDDQLILLRAQGAGPITVRRAGRSLEAPCAMPVVLRDQDLLEIDGRELRVHVHGATDEVHPPERLSRSMLARAARATAAALALSATVGLGGGAAAEPIEVRSQPPEMVARRSVICDVTSIVGKGKAQVHATCPAKTVVAVGAQGNLLDAKGLPIDKGLVVVKKVTGNRIVAEANLATPVKAPKVRIWID